jgi:phage-related baseplate assembly protein
MPNPAWSPNTTVAPFAIIVDDNGNIEQAGANGGITGQNKPNPWGASLNATTQDNSVTWTLVAFVQAPAPAVAGLPADPPDFIVDSAGLDVNAIVSAMIDEYQSITGRIIQPAQVERLYINFAAYVESLVKEDIQYTGEQNLLAFANYPALDFLGELLNVTRLAAQPATTALQFTLANALTVPITIPAGTPVGTSDGQFVFDTDTDLTIQAGGTSGSVNATCTTAGINGNGYLTGQINVLLAPNALIASVTNTSQSNGGSSPETDGHLRARIQAAPNQFSTAGPEGAYRFFALGVDPSIIDVLVTSPAPGQVTVYVLTGPVTQPAASPNNAGIAGSPLLAKVLAALAADDVRPLTDTVAVDAVTEVDYSITATVTLYANADSASTQAACQAAAVLLAQNLAARIQRNVVKSQIIAALSVPGVYEVALTSPPSDVNLSAGQWANCTAISLTFVVGTEVL